MGVRKGLDGATVVACVNVLAELDARHGDLAGRCCESLTLREAIGALRGLQSPVEAARCACPVLCDWCGNPKSRHLGAGLTCPGDDAGRWRPGYSPDAEPAETPEGERRVVCTICHRERS